jgi:hypothetical protein
LCLAAGIVSTVLKLYSACSYTLIVGNKTMSFMCRQNWEFTMFSHLCYILHVSIALHFAIRQIYTYVFHSYDNNITLCCPLSNGPFHITCVYFWVGRINYIYMLQIALIHLSLLLKLLLTVSVKHTYLFVFLLYLSRRSVLQLIIFLKVSFR